MKKSNRLIKEKSPYLLQHAYNPVDWYAWGEEAFAKAKSEDKPVFLSIGYSTCHWCHVMEHESFEDEYVASLMNDTFISIKVDREERPDVDGIYMDVCRMLTGSGGWPLTIILTPEKMPFFAGTYFPRESRFGRPGMIDLIPQIKQLWQTKRIEILNSANEITNVIKQSQSEVNNSKIEEDILNKAFNEFKGSFDSRFGGFGSAPKFPTPHNLVFLLRYWKAHNNPEALNMVEKTLHLMRAGGIYDQIGFGFHRYSTDREWLVPHFEKMLYDQALIAQAYIEAYQATKNNFYKKTAEEILTYVRRDMISPEGGFYSAEDADSEGEEGKFYLWKFDELQSILTEDELKLAVKVFNLEKKDDMPRDARDDQIPNPENGANILHMSVSTETILEEFKLSYESFALKLNSIRTKLFNYRERRVHPYKDDKILTDWNSLMISAFANAYQAFGKEEYLLTAENCISFILNNMKNGTKLLHRFRDGEAAIHGLLDDYAFFIAALLDMYESSFKINYLTTAIELNEYLLEHFLDKINGGFFFSEDKGEKLLARKKEIYDGAVPSGNSIQMMNLLRLARITSNTQYESISSAVAESFSESINKMPSSFTQMLSALNFASGPSYEIVIAANMNSGGTKSMIDAIREKYIPNKVLLLKDPGKEEITSIAPYTKNHNMIDGKVAVYVCRNFVCELPVTDPADLEEILIKA